MHELLDSAISLGPLVLVLGLSTAIACRVVYSFRSERGSRASLLRYALILAAVGAIAWVIGTAIGIAAFCSAAGAGNLCGLGGVFGAGPLVAGIAIGGYAYRWLKGTRDTA